MCALKVYFDQKWMSISKLQSKILLHLLLVMPQNKSKPISNQQLSSLQVTTLGRNIENILLLASACKFTIQIGIEVKRDVKNWKNSGKKQRNSHTYGTYWPSFQSPFVKNMGVVLYNKVYQMIELFILMQLIQVLTPDSNSIKFYEDQKMVGVRTSISQK